MRCAARVSMVCMIFLYSMDALLSLDTTPKDLIHIPPIPLPSAASWLPRSPSVPEIHRDHLAELLAPPPTVPSPTLHRRRAICRDRRILSRADPHGGGLRRGHIVRGVQAISVCLSSQGYRGSRPDRRGGGYMRRRGHIGPQLLLPIYHSLLQHRPPCP
mmetsp:Transcript_21791/g.49557  ORF Transcript_21791/g.49557 Transcript_21791/m.49557 type:complete len:159 (-) Transcript_21791:2079-2555(-)